MLEICCGDIKSVDAAFKGGADRIELCSALEAGGITPSAGLLAEAIWKSKRRECPVPVNVLIRPRSGDFLYDNNELKEAMQDAAYAAGAGADGIVFGALNSDGSVDEYACSEVIRAARSSSNASLTFHRAFDLCRDPFEALETIISLGFDRILTSGLAPSAWDGRDLLRDLVKKAAGRIIIMPGAGVTPDNIAGILNYTGATEIHASAKKIVESRMEFRRGGIGMGSSANDADEYSRYSTSESIVRTLKEKIVNHE